MINDLEHLKNEIDNLNNENILIKLDGEEVILDEVCYVFSCALEKENN